MYATIESIAKNEEGRVVLLASHAGAIRAFWGKITGTPAEDLAAAYPFASNASYSVFEYCDGVFTPIEYSVDNHLSDIKTVWVR